MRQQIAQQNSGFALSEFSRLLAGGIKLQVPVFTVWGACEDVAILERFRTGEYQVPNLFVLDEATTKSIEVGGIRLRLFGLGGAVVLHKLFDNGEGAATIAGGQGTMWTTALQIGELIDTAQKTFDPTETRLLITHASPGREGLLAQLALALKADLTVSAGLHFRYGVSYNEFSVQHDAENYRNKLQHAKQAFTEIWDTVKTQVDAVIDENQRLLLNNALAVANRTAPTATATGAASEEPAWKNTWNWNLPDAAYGNLVLSVRDGRVSAETKSQGFNFAYRRSGQPMSAVTPTATAAPVAAVGPSPSYTPAPTAAGRGAPPAAAPAPVQQKNVPAPTASAAAAPPAQISIKGAAVGANKPVEPSTASNGAATSAPSTATKPAPAAATSTKPVREKKERPAREPRSERGHESAASRSDLETTGGFTSGTDGRRSPSGPTTRKPRNPYTLYVSQLKEALPVTEDELRTYFGPAASGIAGIKLVFDKPHRRGASSGKEDAAQERRQRPFAYVEFKDEAAMAEGLKRQGEKLRAGQECRPVLEQADSNKAAEEGKEVGKRERSMGRKEKSGAAGWETEKDEGKSDVEKKERNNRGGRKERPVKKEKDAAPGAEVGEEGSAAAPAASHNKNKKNNNKKNGEKKEKRENTKEVKKEDVKEEAKPAAAAAPVAEKKDAPTAVNTASPAPTPAAASTTSAPPAASELP